MAEDYKTLNKGDPTSKLFSVCIRCLDELISDFISAPSETLTAMKIKSDFYSPDRLQQMCRLLISEYFFMSDSDWDQLSNNSETYGSSKEFI